MKNTLKKILCVAVLAMALVCALCACNSTAIYDKLGGMCDAEYSKISINVKTEMGGDTLTSTYTVHVVDASQNMASLDYSIQRFATFDTVMDNDIIVAPENRIETISGGVEINGTSVTQKSGTPINIDESKLANICKVNLHFGYLYFLDATNTNETFEAKVKNPSAFMDYQVLTCTDMKVKATFSTKFESILITYTEDGAKNTITYTFE